MSDPSSFLVRNLVYWESERLCRGFSGQLWRQLSTKGSAKAQKPQWAGPLPSPTIAFLLFAHCDEDPSKLCSCATVLKTWPLWARFPTAIERLRLHAIQGSFQLKVQWPIISAEHSGKGISWGKKKNRHPGRNDSRSQARVCWRDSAISLQEWKRSDSDSHSYTVGSSIMSACTCAN